MTLRNEIFEGIAAMKGAQEAFGGTARDRYYEELYKAARRENDDFDARRVARQKAIAAGRPSSPTTPMVPRMATAGSPVVQQAFSPTALPAQQTPGAIYNLTPTYAEGGMVKPFDRRDPTREKFDPEGEGYDDETAEWEGVNPEMNAEDGRMHGMSRVPRTGMQLKGRRHPTFDKAIDEDRRLGYGLEMRDGRYYTQKFADGGAVLGDLQRRHLMENTRAIRQPGSPTPGVPGSMELADEGRTLGDIEGYENEADQIVKQLLGQDQGTTDRINRQVGPPTEPSNFSAAGDWAAEGAKEQVRQRRAARMPGVPTPQEPPPVTTEEFMDPSQDAPGERTLRQSAANRERQRASIDTGPPPEITYPNPLPTSSRFERAMPGIAASAQVGTAGRNLDLQPDPNYDEKERLEYEMWQTRPGLFEQTTEPERAARAKRLEGLEAERAALDQKAAPAALDTSAVAPSATPGGPSPASPYGPANAAPAGDPDNIGQMSLVPRRATTQPNQTPAGGAAVTAQGSRVSGQTNGPPVSNPQPGPTGTTGNRAPPAGSAGANAPSTAPKAGATDGMAPGPNGTRVPRGSLRDQTRTAAFDPVADFNDPARVAATAPLTSYTPQDFTQVMQGAASVAQQGPVGSGAISRPNFNAYVQKNSQGGRFTPGEAMLVGMLSDYKMLLSQGRIDQANKMAFGLIQAASLEAASYAMVARDALASGDHVAALNNGVEALNYLPDGKTFKASPDGKTIYAFNAQTGQPTGQAQVSPQQLLALITGVADGSLLWQALQSSAAALTKPDRNAEGRQLTNMLRREQIEGARLRNAKLRSGGGGRSGGGFSDVGSRLNALLSGGQPRERAAPVQGDDTGYVDVEVSDPPDE